MKLYSSPPPRVSNPHGAPIKFSSEAKQLRENPGSWGKLTFKSGTAANAVATRVRKGRAAAFRNDFCHWNVEVRGNEVWLSWSIAPVRDNC